jgi:beta-aspartyl-dipeptidase (metallo-type)
MIILIKNAEVYAPEYLGKKDILLAGGEIEAIEKKIEVPKNWDNVKVIDAKGKKLLPGFIDSHVHIAGGGGEGGYTTRTPEIQFSQIVEGGVTTVVGCIGTDGVCRDMKALLAKARALEEEGITTYVFTGSYRIPVKTLMENIQEDILLIDKIIGVGEIAVSDHRSSHVTFEEFIKVVTDARVAGMLSGKAGVVNVHLGDGKLELSYLDRMEKETDIPLTQLVPTHINRSHALFKKAIAYAKKGGFVDFTTSTTGQFLEGGEMKCSKGLKIMIDEGVDIGNISFTSDAQGSLPEFDSSGKFVRLGIGSVKSLYSEVKDAVLLEGIALEDAIKVITSNVADHLKLKNKGRISVGYHADLVLVDSKTLEISHVIAKGVEVIAEGKTLVKGTFEK